LFSTPDELLFCVVRLLVSLLLDREDDLPPLATVICDDCLSLEVGRDVILANLVIGESSLVLEVFLVLEGVSK
jgi:hypothetical protein